MHVAAMNGFVEVLSVLINEGGGNPSLQATVRVIFTIHSIVVIEII